MKGKTIVHLHIDTAYGREPLPAMRQIAKDWDFKLIEIAVPPPGLEQQSQWLQIRKEKADWVTFWGAGSGMNSTAITTAARVGFPRDKMIYVTFGGAEEDMIPAGDAAKGTYVAANAAPGKDYPLIADIEKVVYGAGKGNMQNPERVGTVYYNRGVGAAVMWIEALKNAQKIHNKVGKTVNGAEFRDGYEALDITDDEAQGDRHPRHVGAVQDVLREARWFRALQDDAVGRQEVPDRDGLGAGARPGVHPQADRGLGGEVRHREQHHAAQVLLIDRAC